jgi:hypothetical protein
MTRRICPELYPDPRPSRLFAPLLPYLPIAVRAMPWLVAAPAALVLGVLLVATVPVTTWSLLCLALLTPLVAGVLLVRQSEE